MNQTINFFRNIESFDLQQKPTHLDYQQQRLMLEMLQQAREDRSVYTCCQIGISS